MNQATRIDHKAEYAKYGKAIFSSVSLHIALILLLILNVDLKLKPENNQTAMVIDAVVVDSSLLEPPKVEKPIEKKVDTAALEKQKQAKLEREKKAEEKKAKERAKQKRLAEEKRQTELRKQQERERIEAMRQEELAREQARLKAEEELAQQKLLEEQRALEVARARELQASELAVLRSQYQSAINQKISRNWIKPVSTQEGDQCEILINQIPGGEVINVIVESCSGDGVFQRSVENAVGKVSPLPYEGFEKVFDRNIRLIFRAEQ